MLTSASDRPADPAIGHVFPLLEPGRVLEMLRERNGRTSRKSDEWTACRVIESLYDPGEHIRAAYALLKDDNVRHERSWPAGDVVYLRYPVRRSMSRRGEILRIGTFDFEYYRFPNDRRMRGLRKFASRDRAAGVWQGWLDDVKPEIRLDPATLHRSLLRYVPEQKWIAHLRAEFTDHASGASGKRGIAVRAGQESTCREIFTRSKRIRKLLKKADGAFRVPAPLAFDPALSLVAISWVWGRSLVDTLQSADASKVMRDVTRGLHVFHQMSMPALPEITSKDHLDGARQGCRDLALVCPEQRDNLEILFDALSQRCPDRAEDWPGTIHGDFHWNQLRFRKHRITVLDYERVAQGDRWFDVANFAIQLSMLRHRRALSVTSDQADDWIGAFLEHWQSLTGKPLPQQRMRWYAATALVTLARGMMRHLRPGWPAIVDDSVRTAIDLLSCRERTEVFP